MNKVLMVFQYKKSCNFTIKMQKVRLCSVYVGHDLTWGFKNLYSKSKCFQYSNTRWLLNFLERSVLQTSFPWEIFKDGTCSVYAVVWTERLYEWTRPIRKGPNCKLETGIREVWGAWVVAPMTQDPGFIIRRVMFEVFLSDCPLQLCRATGKSFHCNHAVRKEQASVALRAPE